MAASNTDKFKKARRKFTTTVGVGGISSSGTTLPLTDATGLDTDTAVVVVIDAYDNTGAKTPNLEEVVVGIVSGNSLVNCVRGKEGTNAQAHAEGANVTMYFTETHWDDLVSGILTDHNQDGTHKPFTEANIIDTAQIKDNAVTTSKLLDASVTSAKMAVNLQPEKLQAKWVVADLAGADQVPMGGSWHNLPLQRLTGQVGGYTLTNGGIKVPLSGLYQVNFSWNIVDDAGPGNTHSDILAGINVAQGATVPLAPGNFWTRGTMWHGSTNYSYRTRHIQMLYLSANDIVYAYTYWGQNAAYRIAGYPGSDGSFMELFYVGA